MQEARGGHTRSRHWGQGKSWMPYMDMSLPPSALPGCTTIPAQLPNQVHAPLSRPQSHNEARQVRSQGGGCFNTVCWTILCKESLPWLHFIATWYRLKYDEINIFWASCSFIDVISPAFMEYQLCSRHCFKSLESGSENMKNENSSQKRRYT